MATESEPPSTLGNVFVSYARNDDLQEIPGVGRGFVTTLWQHLQLRFQIKGPPSPQLFRDTREIWDSDQFEPLLFDRISTADAMLVVLSNNWVHRPWCLKELEWFENVWRPIEGDNFRSRIIVVAKSPVSPELVPAALGGQGGHRFFRIENDLGKPEAAYEYFWHGEPRPEFHDAIDRLVGDLYSRQGGRREHAPGGRPRPKVSQPGATVTPMAPRVYVAKPAGDMEQQYRRLVGGLATREHVIVPDPDVDIPVRGARNFISAQMETARTSLHLLGASSGFTPEDGIPIVALQLQLARARAAMSRDEATSLKRLIWTPRMFVANDGTPVERDADAVLAQFDQPVEGDKIDDNDIVRFIEFAIQHLEREDHDDDIGAPLPEGAKIYVYHRPEDREYGRSVARALRELKFQPLVPRTEGDLARQIHESTLRECDAVLLGWVAADDSWICATARNWQDWRSLGRERAFACRGLVIGPPTRAAKDDMVDFPPPELDFIVDIRDTDGVPSERLAELVRRVKVDDGA